MTDLPRIWPVYSTWAPPPEMTVSEWADAHGIIPPGVSGQAGNQKFRARPPQRAILDAHGHPRIRVIDIQKSARIGWTLILQLVCGYWCHHNPRSILVTQPTEEDAREWSKEALDPFIEDVPQLAELFNAPEVRAASTILHKFYTQGSIRLRGMQTGRGLRRFTVGGVVLDEIDAYPLVVNDDGDPVQLAAVRAETVWNSVISRGSTPLLDGFSRIQKLIAGASTGWYLLECPHCGLDHVRLFRQPEEPLEIDGEAVPVMHLVWPKGQPEKATYLCPGCAHHVTQRHHTSMMEGGHWRGPDWAWRHGEGFDFDDSFLGHIGFRIWAGYNVTPRSTPSALARDWLEAKGDPEARQVFINTRLGEPYKDQGEQPAAGGLMARCEEWPDGLACPVDVDGVTAMVDVQGDRFEVEVAGWKFHDRESWSMDYAILPATPDSDPTSESWDDLFDFLEGLYETPAGPRHIDAIGIDCGFLQDRVMAFIKKRSGGRMLPLKGTAGERSIVEPIADRIKRLKRLATRGEKVRPVLVGVDAGKLAVYRALQVSQAGPRYCHFPAGRDEGYFESLTAERLLTRYRKGFPVREWHKVRERNEALDCRVGALAMCIMMEQKIISRRPAPGAPRARKQRRQRESFAPSGWGLGQ